MQLKWYRVGLMLVLTLTIYSCTLDEGRKVDLEHLSFDTTDDSEIFFKNLRQSTYQREEVERMTVFKNKDYMESEDSIGFQIKIVWSWYNDKAFILLETAAETEDSIYLDLGQQTERLTISESASAADQTNAACEIYNSLVDKKPIVLTLGQSKDTLFRDKLSREAFRVTMSDYLRLTNNF